MNKLIRFAALFLALMMLTPLWACKGKPTSSSHNNKPTAFPEEVAHTEEPPAAHTEEPPATEIPGDAKLSASENCVKEFLTALSAENYADALDMLAIADKTFITAADLEWYLPRSDFADAVGASAEDITFGSEGSKPIDYIDAVGSNYDLHIAAELNDNNEWKVKFPAFVIENCLIRVPSKMPVTLNGVEVTSKYREKTEDMREIYRIPALPNRNITVVLSSETFGELEQEILPTASDTIDVPYVLKTDQYQPIYDAIKTLLNTVHKAYEEGAAATDFSEYISKYADPQLAQNLRNYIDCCYQSSSSIFNVQYTVVKESPQKNAKPAFIVCDENNIIAVNLAIEKIWNSKFFGSVSTDNTKLVGWLRIEWKDSQVYFFEIPGDNFISESNGFTHDW